MTERLYYDDPYCREFDASIVRVEARGDRRAVWLDRSAFYPTSGGQPFDTGTIESVNVFDVTDEDDDVVHTVEGSGSLHVGQRVRGRVDWDRRFDHMQHHTGQHVLSAAFVHRFGVPTVSFHLGSDGSTIDLAAELSRADIAAAENEANRIVWEDRPVTVRYASAEEAATLGLRKPSQRTGTLRLIDVESWDLSACGGTHVQRTGAIGLIAVTGWERFRGGQRIQFLCGARAARAYRELRDGVGASVRLLSVLPAELPGAIERLQGLLREQERSAAALRTELAGHQAEALARTAEQRDGIAHVYHAVDGDQNTLRTLAAALVTRPGLVVVLASTVSPALVVAARSADVTVACDALVASLIARFGGRGGGRSDFAQAGKLDATADVILAQARKLL